MCRGVCKNGEDSAVETGAGDEAELLKSSRVGVITKGVGDKLLDRAGQAFKRARG